MLWVGVKSVGMWRRLIASNLLGGIATRIWTEEWKRKRRERHEHQPLQHPYSRLVRFSVACYATLHPALSVYLSVYRTLLFLSFSGLWLHGSCPSDQVISNMSHAHPHATGVAVNPALFLLVLFCDHFTVYVYVLHWALSPNITCGSYSILLFKPSPHARRDPLTCFC